MEASGAFETTLSRRGEALTGYRDRIAASDAWEADLFVSIHSDVRGAGTSWSPLPGTECMRSDGALGFSVLWSDEGDAELVASRLEAARAVAGRLRAAGFPAYDGVEYETMYEGDPAHPGVFVDRHRPHQRIMVLRRPEAPSILIETHHAWHPGEEQRWLEAETIDVFASAVLAALVDLG